ncbi:MAG: hypothetical protein ACK5LZ_04750 [Anaerorhabdus sp.]
MIKNYRLNEQYIEKLREIKKSIQRKKEYENIKLNDTDVIKIIIDDYHEKMKSDTISEGYIEQLLKKIVTRFEAENTKNFKQINLALQHSNKLNQANTLLINHMLEFIEVDTEELEDESKEMIFSNLAKEIEYEIREKK